MGRLIFVLALIPFGPILIWEPAAVWLYLEGHTGAAAFIVVWSIAAGFLTDNVLRPYLISRGSDLPLILMVFGVVAGVVTFRLPRPVPRSGTAGRGLRADPGVERRQSGGNDPVQEDVA